MKRRRSIKTKVLAVLLLTQIPLITIIIVYNFYFVNYFNQSLSTSNQNALASYCDILEDDLERLNSGLLNYVASDVYFKMLSTDSHYLDAHVHSLEIIDHYNTLLEENRLLYGCYVINSKYGIFRESYAPGKSEYTVNEWLRDYFGTYLEREDSVFEDQWKPLTFGEQSFLYMLKGIKGTYSVYLIDMPSVHVPQDENGASSGKIVFFDGTQVLNNASDISEAGILLKGQDDYYFSGNPGKYLIIEQPMELAQLRAAYIMPYRGIIGNLSVMQQGIIIFSVVIMLLMIPVGFLALRRVFYKPIDRLVETMEAIREGKLETRADEDYTETEFLTMNQTFNAMISEINALKIESYEKALDLQRTQLDYYQTQIRPHFYVNCLKSIYGLLEDERLEDSKKAVVYLSKHLRYMLKGPSVAVTMAEELEYVNNYIQLQQISMAYPPRLTVEIEESIKDQLIPAISILSFVENSVKYGGKMNQNLVIGIYISRIISEDGSFINLAISDNGPGFPEAMLEKLNLCETPDADGHHIGIYNVMQRFILYYGQDRVLFAFSNIDGAHVDIFIREDRKEEKP